MRFDIFIRDVDADTLLKIHNAVKSASDDTPNQQPEGLATLPDGSRVFRENKFGGVLTTHLPREEEEEAPGAVVLDTSGVPWDERIHSGNKKQTTKGVWGRRRNLDDATFNTIHAQLLAAQAAPVVIAGGGGDAALHPANSNPLIQGGGIITPPPPPPPLTTAPPVADVPKTFQEFVNLTTAKNPEGVRAACVSQGLANVGDLFQRPDLIPAVWAQLA